MATFEPRHERNCWSEGAALEVSSAKELNGLLCPPWMEITEVLNPNLANWVRKQLSKLSFIRRTLPSAVDTQPEV